MSEENQNRKQGAGARHNLKTFRMTDGTPEDYSAVSCRAAPFHVPFNSG
jgi:hypothetical protein